MMGTKTPETTSSITNVLEFWFKSKLLEINTCAPVRVLEVNTNKTVDVELMIQGLNADNQAIPPINIYNCPFVSLISGNSGIISPPEVGDIGIMIFCQRDITKITDTQQTGIPDTLRKFSLSDGIYLFSLYKDTDSLNSSITITDNEIKMAVGSSEIDLTETKITVNSDNVEIKGNIEIDISAPKVITLANNQNAVSLLKEVVDTLATACALPTAPGQPVITPADLILIQTKLALLAGFE